MPPPKPGMTPDQLKKLLEHHGLNQTTGAARIGVSRHTVFRWVNGLSTISIGQAMLIRDRLKK